MVRIYIILNNNNNNNNLLSDIEDIACQTFS